MLRFLWKLVRAVLILLAVVVAIPVLGLAYGFLTTDAPPPSSAARPRPPRSRSG
jgi:hypothetical protein